MQRFQNFSSPKFNYELLKFLGSGAFGATYQASSPDGSLVAIKFLFPTERSKHDAEEEISNYMKIVELVNQDGMSNISCPSNLLCFHSWGEILPTDPNYQTVYSLLRNKYEGNKPLVNVPIFYIITDFLEGSDLSEIIKTGNKPSEEELRIFLRDIFNAIIYLHGKNLAHRDIKPNNIIRTYDGRYVLIDFGIVCSQPVCFISGTPAYLTNELELLMLTDVGFPLVLAMAGDLFALGVTFYEYATASRMEMKRLAKTVYKVTSLPDPHLTSKFLSNTYKDLIYNYNYMVIDNKWKRAIHKSLSNLNPQS